MPVIPPSRESHFAVESSFRDVGEPEAVFVVCGDQCSLKACADVFGAEFSDEAERQ